MEFLTLKRRPLLIGNRARYVTILHGHVIDITNNNRFFFAFGHLQRSRERILKNQMYRI